MIAGLGGTYTANQDLSTDGSHTVDLGDGLKNVALSANDVDLTRLNFTSAEVGNGDPDDGGILSGQDGGLAVRVQAVGADGSLIGPVSRYDDESI